MPAFPDALAALPEIPEPEEGEDPNFDIAVALGEDPPEEPEPEAEPETPEAEPETPEPEPDLTEAYRSFGDAYRENPVTFLAQLTQGLDESQKAVLLAQLGINPEPAPTNADEGWTDDDLANASDFFVREHREHIANLPKFQQQVANDLNTVGNYVGHLAYQNALLEARLSLALEAAGVSLPDVDEKAIAALAQKGKSYKEAVEEAYVKPTKRTFEAAKAKQTAKASLPTTPRDSGSDDDGKIDMSAITKKKNPSLNDFLPAARQILAARSR